LDNPSIVIGETNLLAVQMNSITIEQLD